MVGLLQRVLELIYYRLDINRGILLPNCLQLLPDLSICLCL